MKKFVATIIHLLITLWAGARKYIKDNVQPTVKVLNAINDVVKNPALDIAVALTKTGLDDALLKKIRLALSAAIDLLEIPLECTHGTDEEKIKCFIEHLRNVPVEARHMLYAKLNSLVANILSEGNKFTQAEQDLLASIGFAWTKVKTQAELNGEIIPEGKID